MEYRNIFLANPARLSVQREQLVIEQAEKITVPLEDISSVLIESQQVTLSVHAAAAMADHGITVFLCDEKHLPSCQLLPINQFCRQRKLLLSQCEMGKPLQKQLWQQIVVRKIQNQAQCLRLMGKEEWQELQQMAGKVLSNDSDNREAVAAALYFPALFGNGFFRGSDDPRNAALNYGYAVMRAGIARNLVVHGLEPCIGLHHRSELNNFNLADDLIEPFRPIVDLYVAQNFSKDDVVLTPRQKAGLFNLTNYLVKQAGRRYRVMLSIDRVCMALANSVTAGENLLELPELIPLELHSMNRLMRILVMFDLPVKTKAERRSATQFRNFLVGDGYHMVQYSVYARVCNGRDSVETHKKRILLALPSKGSVRMLVITEKQYNAIDCWWASQRHTTSRSNLSN